MTESTPAETISRFVAFFSGFRLGSHRQAGLWPTGYGWAYLVLVAAMLAGSINYGNNFGFLLTFLMAGLGLMSLLQPWRNLRTVVLVSAKAAPVFAGDTAMFAMVVQGGSVDRPAVEIYFENAPANGLKTQLDADRNHRLRLSHPAPRRGRLITAACMITTVYPLGLFRGRRVLADHLECLVYPAPLEDQRPPLAARHGAPGGENPDENRSGNQDFRGLNAYRPGDPLRRISWKASSRGQGLYTKEFSGAGAKRRTLDWAAIAEPDVERKLSILCGQVLDADRRGIAYGLEIPGQSIAPGNGEAHRHRCLAALAGFPKPEPS